jgi:hypothetical protein
MSMISKLFSYKRTVGCFEQVGLPEYGTTPVLAKIDTGAYSGAIHATDIKVVRRGKEKTRILKFRPLGDENKLVETEVFFETKVKSAFGQRRKRFIVDTVISVDGRQYPIRIGLSDRSDMKSAVLIGRRFLRENGLKVDVRRNQEIDDEGKETE